MGKIFVKAPAESPDDLLSKESQLGRAGRVLADAGEGAVGMAEPIPNFGALMRKPLGALRYLAEGRYKRKLSPEEEAEQKFLTNQAIKNRYRESMQPQIDAQAALAAKQKEQAAALAAKQKEQADFDYLQSVDPKFAQKNFMTSVYGNRSIGDAAKLERRSQDNYAAQQRLEALRAEPKHKRAAAKNAAEELQLASAPSLEETAANLPPVPPQGQPGAPPPEPAAGGYPNETNSDKLSEDAIINNTGYDLDGETQNVEMLKPQKEEEEEVPPPSNVPPAPNMPQPPIDPKEPVDDKNIY